MANDLIKTGKVVNTHGIRGELRVEPWADTPDLLMGFKHFTIDGTPVRVITARVHKNNVIVKLDGIDNIDSAIKMKNKIVCVKRDDIKLEPDTYLVADLLGLVAIDADTGDVLGTVSDILPLPAHNVYVIKREREILIPAVSEFIAETNIDKGFIKFRLIEGL